MKKLITGSLVIIGLTLFSPLAKAVVEQTITFDDLAGDALPIANGYAGLNWNNVLDMNPSLFGISGTGFGASVVSSQNMAFNIQQPATISSDTPFNFESGYFTSAWNKSSASVIANGYLNGVLVQTATFDVNSSSPTLVNLDFSGINSITFEDNAAFGNKAFIGMDNLKVGLNAAVGAAPGAPAPSLTACLAFAGVLLLQALRQRKSA